MRTPLAIALLSVACLTVAVPVPAGGKRSVADLIAELRKEDASRTVAIAELEALGAKAAEAAPALVALFETKNEDLRLQAAMALGKIKKGVVEPLVKALASSDADVRFYAAWALAFVGPEARSATPAVVKALADPSPDVRRKAAFALEHMDADPALAAAPLVAALGDDNDDVRQAVVAALPHMGKAAVAPLIKSLDSDKKTLREMAARTLGKIGAAAEPAIPTLKGLLLDPKKGLADSAADALAGIGSAALPALTAATESDDGAVRALAVRSLHKIGVPAVPTMVDLLGAKHPDVRRSIASLLGGMHVNDKSVVIALGYATKDKDFETRRNALASIRAMGTQAKLAEPYIVALLTDIDAQMRVDAFHALQGLGVDPKPGLKKALSNPDQSVRIATASLMAALNLEVELAEPILLEGLKHKDEALKMQAAHALSLRGLKAEEVLPIFIAGLKGDLPSVRRQAAESIARYGVKAGKIAGPVLLATLDDGDDSVRAAALAALKQTGADPKALFPAMAKILTRKTDPLHGEAAKVIFQVGPEAIPELITFLKKDDTPALRLACLQTLAMVGPPAKAAVAELARCLEDPEARIRMTAARALGNIGPDAKAALPALAKAREDADANVKAIAKAATVQINTEAKDGFEVIGILTPGDPQDPVRRGSFHVVHVYRMTKGQKVQIDLMAGYDTFLRLENGRGVQLAQDDDGGDGLNSRLHFVAPEDGWYRIIVTTFAGGASGPYTLRVK